ncbi:MAG TPA: phospholipase D family protein [Longimicrobium sp.]|jgi:phosphatidylserine/phosphatidylglycerophosphate/cardiolipin synthase-like enzyme
MAEFLTTAGVADKLEQIIRGAKERLVLVSPYLQLSRIWMQRLHDAEGRGVSITFVYGKQELKQEQIDLLAMLKKPTLYYLENLHAKCYMNESSMVITSMNLYEFSEKTNREMGVMVVADEPVFMDAAREVDSIIRAAARKPNPVVKADARPAARGRGGSPAGASRTRGSCIRCLTEIPRNVSRPLCRSCYDTWSAFGNPDYPERACHQCGTASDVSVARPLCRACYRTT